MKLPKLDPHPFARGGSVAIVSVSVVHLVDTLWMLIFPVSRDATCMSAIISVMHAVAPWLGINGLAVFMAISAVVALMGAFCRLGFIRLAAFLPQHLFLGMMTAGGLYAAKAGAYLDGTVMAGAHVFTDQNMYIAMFVVHSSAILRRARDPNG